MSQVRLCRRSLDGELSIPAKSTTHDARRGYDFVLMTAPIPVMTLEYAHPQSLGSIAARTAFRRMLFLTILSGCCVASCFLVFTETVLGTSVQALVFAITIAMALASGKALLRSVPASDDPGRVPRTALDCVSLVGLAMIAVVPLGYEITKSQALHEWDAPFAGLIGIAYALMTVSTARHVMLYRLLAGLCRAVNHTRMARSLILLGWFKAIYEFLWLGCCAAALLLAAARDVVSNDVGNTVVFFAVGALFGLAGYAIIWIWMIVAHAQLLRVAR
jgi:hypothetical protein